MKEVLPSLVILFVVGVSSNIFGSMWDCGPNQKLSNLICKCPIDPDYVQKVNHSLHESIFGQKEVLRLVSESIQLHNFEDTAQHPTALHFAGDNGVGKTLVSFKIANAIYSKKDKDMPSGLLYIRGNIYRGITESHIEEQRTKLRAQIFGHLYSCPRGLIVVDEAELIHPLIIAVFQEFLDTTHPYMVLDGYQARLSQAIYIFITDFGVEGRTENMDLKEITELVHNGALLRWEDPKQTALIPWIVPFSTLNDEGLKDYLDYLLRSLKTHPKITALPFKTLFLISESSRLNLFNLIKQNYKDKHHRYKNYRGVEEIFDSLVLGKIITELIQKKILGKLTMKLVVDTEEVKFVDVEIIENKDL